MENTTERTIRVVGLPNTYFTKQTRVSQKIAQEMIAHSAPALS